MKYPKKFSFPILAVALALCLPGLAHAQVSATEPAARNIPEMKFGPVSPLPTCMSGAVQSGDPAKGAFIVAVKLNSGCTIPWHWHSAGEYLMIVSGSGRMEMKDNKPKTIRAGSYVQLPPRHIHQFQCKNKCTFFFYSDGAWDMHYVDAKGTEITPEDALKAVKEKPAQAMK